MKRKPFKLKPYKTYRFKGQDPIVDRVFDATDGYKLSQLSAKSGVSVSTISNWFKGKTKRPQFATINAVLIASGHELKVAKTIAARRREAREQETRPVVQTVMH
jgi:hypothetical protein